ncbi:hypothetical protein OSB04_007534, partial [Centaurea solstitialis]
MWVVCGDFNEVRSGEERLGSSLDRRGTKLFNDFIAAADLHDLRLGGRKFTWMNADCSKLSKLDRFLVNQNSLTTWPLMNEIALPRVFSDHCPIMLGTKEDFGPIPFKLFNSWLGLSDFGDLVKDKWNDNPPCSRTTSKIDCLSINLRHLKSHIKIWSKELRKKDETELFSLKSKICSIDLLAELNQIDDNLVNERMALLAKVKDLMTKKVSDIKQKAKCKWLREGDENSRFFHSYVNNKAKRGRIHGLNINGNWETKPELIKEAVWKFFDKKFSESHPIRPSFKSRFFKKISTEQKEWLDAPFPEQEIKQAVWNCGYNKAPGPDGFTLEFVRKFWNIVGKDFVEAVKHFEQHKQIKPGSNSSFIALIPKISDPLSLSDYRPINLIGCVNKGVRQDDPLAPSLFIVAAEGLAILMKEAQQANIFRGVKFHDLEEGSLPVGGNMHLAKHWQPLIDNFKVKLIDWKAKLLSSGGRNCLCKSVLGALGTYWFSLYKAPKKVLQQLESMRRRFFWGATTDTKKICWMAWDKVIRDKKCGGLGIGSLYALNLALLMKWRWREKIELNAIWSKVVRICAGRPRAGSVSNHNRGTWNTICRVETDLLEMGINVGHFLKPKEDGNGWVWELEPNKSYTVRSLGRLIDGVKLPSEDAETEWIRGVPSKINIFLWRVLHNRLPTRDNLLNRGVVLPSYDCPLCHVGPECNNHLMISCSTVKMVSALLGKWVDWWPMNSSTIADFWEMIRMAGKRLLQADFLQSDRGGVSQRDVDNKEQKCVRWRSEAGK